jgi:hypothetical protein
MSKAPPQAVSVASVARELVYRKYVVVLESRVPGQQTRVTVSRGSNIDDLLAFHNRQGKKCTNAATLAGSPHWRVVAVVAPLTEGSTKVKQRILALYQDSLRKSPATAAVAQVAPLVCLFRESLPLGVDPSVRMALAALHVARQLDIPCGIG